MNAAEGGTIDLRVYFKKKRKDLTS